MQQLKVCKLADHNSITEYVCLYAECKQNRFLCSDCIKDGIHKHDQQNDHILNQKTLCDKIKGAIQIKDKEANSQQFLRSIQLLQQMNLELNQRLNNLNSIITEIESGQLQNNSKKQLEELFLSVEKDGFNLIGNQQLELLIYPNKQELIYQQLTEQSEIIAQIAKNISEWRLPQVNLSQLQMIQEANYKIQLIEDVYSVANPHYCKSGAISNDLLYISVGQSDGKLKIWNYDTLDLIKETKLDSAVVCCKFTDDSKFLYVGTVGTLYQLDVKDNFNQLFYQKIHVFAINNIYCISNTLILSSEQCSIIKTDIDKKQEIFKINPHYENSYGLDYNKTLNVFVSGSLDRQIRLWNGNDGQLMIKKDYAHDQEIRQVLFLNNNQIIGSDYFGCILIWNINFEILQFVLKYSFETGGCTLSLVLNCQFIVVNGDNFIKIYSVLGNFIRQIDHDVKMTTFNEFCPSQLESMKAVLILGYGIKIIYKNQKKSKFARSIQNDIYNNI